MLTSTQQLQAEHDLLGAVLNGMRDGILLLDKAGTVLLTNSALREMFLSGANPTGKPLTDSVNHPELNSLVRRCRERSEPVGGEIELTALQPRRLRVHIAPLGQNAGSKLAVFVDVTEVRHLESIRRDFVSNASHELRTPVAAIRSASETLLASALRDPVSSLRFAEIIERNATRLQELIGDLLDLSRIESHQLKLNPSCVRVAPLLAHAVTLVETQASEHRVDIGVFVTPSDAEITIDRQVLERVLVNLIENAVKYCPEGRVDVRAELRGDMFRLDIEDTGPGIEAKHLPRLFERFYRVDGGRCRNLGGTGLGLAIVKHLVETIGGAISVESTVGKGSRFTVLLPHDCHRPSVTYKLHRSADELTSTAHDCQR